MLTASFVYSIVIFKFYKCKSSLLLRLLLRWDADWDYLSELVEWVAQILRTRQNGVSCATSSKVIKKKKKNVLGFYFKFPANLLPHPHRPWCHRRTVSSLWRQILASQFRHEVLHALCRLICHQSVRKKGERIFSEASTQSSPQSIIHQPTIDKKGNCKSPTGTPKNHPYLVWSVLLCLIDHVRLGECDEAKTAGPLRLGVLHHHNVDDLAVLFEVCLQAVVCGAVVQATDEQLAHLFGLGMFLWGAEIWIFIGAARLRTISALVQYYITPTSYLILT